MLNLAPISLKRYSLALTIASGLISMLPGSRRSSRSSWRCCSSSRSWRPGSIRWASTGIAAIARAVISSALLASGPPLKEPKDILAYPLLQSNSIAEAYADPRFDPSADQSTGYRTRNILCVPLRDSHGRLFGVAQLLNKQGTHPFDSDDERHFQEFMGSMGVILESWWLMSQRNAALRR